MVVLCLCRIALATVRSMIRCSVVNTWKREFIGTAFRATAINNIRLEISNYAAMASLLNAGDYKRYINARVGWALIQ